MNKPHYSSPAVLGQNSITFETTISKWKDHDHGGGHWPGGGFDLGDLLRWLFKHKPKPPWWPW
jgi:hypothetical protein